MDKLSIPTFGKSKSKETIAALTADIERLTKEKEEAVAFGASMQQMVQTVQTEYRQRKTELDDAHREVETQKAEIARLVASCQGTHHGSAEGAEDDANENGSRRNAAAAWWDEAEKKLNARVQELEADFSVAKERLVDALAAKESAEHSAAAVRAEAQALRKAHDALESEAITLREAATHGAAGTAALSEVNRELAAGRDREKALAKELADAKEENARIRDFKRKLEAHQKQSDLDQAEIAKLRMTERRLGDEVVALTKDLQAADAKVAEARQRALEYEKVAYVAKESVGVIEAAAADARTALAAEQARRKEATEDLAEYLVVALASAAAAAGDGAAAVREIARLEEELATAAAAAAEKDAAMSALEASLRDAHGDARLRMRRDANVIAELQRQLLVVAAGGDAAAAAATNTPRGSVRSDGGGDATAVTGGGIVDALRVDLAALVKANGALQERCGGLREQVESLTAQVAELTESLKVKDRIIRRYVKDDVVAKEEQRSESIVGQTASWGSSMLTGLGLKHPSKTRAKMQSLVESSLSTQIDLQVRAPCATPAAALMSPYLCDSCLPKHGTPRRRAVRWVLTPTGVPRARTRVAASRAPSLQSLAVSTTPPLFP